MADPCRRGDNGTVNSQSGLGRQMSPRVRVWLRQALAFARSTEPRTAPSRRSVAVDAGLAAATLVASMIAIGQASPAGLFSAVVITVPLALRRIRPLTAFWVVFVGIFLAGSYFNIVMFIAVLLAAYSAVVYSRYRGAALISVPLAGLIITAIFSDTTLPVPGRLTALFILVPVALVGNAVLVWRRRVGDSQARLRQTQAEHEAATARALAAERARIAGELHDVVTHNVSVMVVQAGAARRVLAASPGEATAALLAVEASGRTAMIELQHLLGLLSPVDGMQPPGAGPLRPQPGLDRLQPLIDRVAAAGLPVDLTVSGRPRALPPGLDLACYRVVQEALTNVIKHAGQARTAVRLDYRPDELIIDVTDDGPAVSARPGGGRGLLGLRERVSLYGGEFDAGPRPAGGWRVTARLPLEPQPADTTDTADAGPAPGSVLAPVPARP